MALLSPTSPLQANNVHLWWNWDLFAAIDNPERNSLQALSRLAGAMSLDPAKIHPVPSSTVSSDPEVGAAQYAQELRENTPIDSCLLEMSPEGQVAGIFPRHLLSPTEALVAGITDAGLPHPELVTMTRAGLNTCREIWILATGAEVAPTVHRVHCNDRQLPATHLTGLESALWLVDDPAAALLPFHHCTL
jgi:6-phosphogluconolactonase